MSKTYTLPIIAMAQLLSGSAYDTSAESYKLDFNRAIYWQPEELPSGLQDLDPTAFALHFYQSSMGSGDYDQIGFYQLSGKLDISADVFPGLGSRGTVPIFRGYGWKTYTLDWNDWSTGPQIHSWIRDGFGTKLYAHSAASILTPRSSYSPYIVLTYNEGSRIVVNDAPGGHVDRTAAVTFSWHATYQGFPIEEIAQNKAVLRWKNGPSGTVNTVNISGSTTSYTMAANTLPESSDLYWQVQFYYTASASVTSDWTSFRTTDTEGVCTGISPSGVYIDGTEETRFVWSWSNETGTAPTGYDLQVKGPADVDFSTVKSETTANTFAVVAANTLPGGQIQWRVRGYNQSSVAGDWSDPLSCVVISAPAKPSVWTEDASPRPTVAWTSTGQLGFRVLIPGVYDSGTVFGTVRSFKIPQYLDNDIYEIRVYILGEYDLWSKYGWNYATILNSGTGSCTLTAQAEDGDAVLSWTAVENALGYQILRGDKAIAETASTEYVDRYAIGEVSYRVRTILASDAYVMSNTAAVTLRVRSPRITALDGNWIELDMYTSPLPTTQITATRDVALMTYAGRDYPVAEVSPHRTRTWVAYPAFRDPAQAAAFEQLLGRPVFVKDQYGTSMTGIMSSVQRGAQTIYTSMTAVVQEIGGYDL